MSKGIVAVDLYLAKGGSVPTGAITHPGLYRKVVAKAKKKFKVYPSPFTKAWIDAEYRKRGGDYNYSFNYKYQEGGENSQDFINFEKTNDMKGYHLMPDGTLMPNGQMAYPFAPPEYNYGGTPCYNCGGMYKKGRMANGGIYEGAPAEYVKPVPAQKRSYPMYAKRVVNNVPTYYKGSGYYTPEEFSKMDRKSFVPGIPQVTTQEEYERTLAETPYNIVYPTYKHGGRAVQGSSQEQVMEAMAPYHDLPQMEYDQKFYELFGQYPQYRTGGQRDADLMMENMISFSKGGINSYPQNRTYRNGGREDAHLMMENMVVFSRGGTNQRQGGAEDSHLLMENTDYFAKGGSKKNWIPKNLKKGRCTPAPNPDCPKGSPQYNLAMTFKKHKGFHKKQNGGEAPFGETSQDFLQNRQSDFLDSIRNNTISSMAMDEADGITQEVSNFMQDGGYSTYNPNLYNQESYQESSNNLNYSPEEFIGDIRGVGNIASDFYRNGGYYRAQNGIEIPGKELPAYLPSGETQYIQNVQGFPVTAEELYSPDSPINVQNMGMAYPEQGQPNTNTNTKKRFRPGVGTADALLAGMSLTSGLLEQKEKRKQEELLRKRRIGDAVFTPAPTSQGSRGDYDINSGLFRPDQMVPVQFQGQTSRHGGMTYKQGGEYELTDEEIQQIVRTGGTIEYLD